MEQTLPFDFVTTAGGFAINRNVFGISDFQSFDEKPVGFFERVGIEQFKDAVEGVV